MNEIKRTLTGEGISAIFGGFPDDMTIGEEYTLYWDFELKQYLVDGEKETYKAMSFAWDKALPQ